MDPELQTILEIADDVIAIEKADVLRAGKIAQGRALFRAMRCISR